MADWTISVVQVPIILPIYGDTGFRHNAIIFKDSNGNVFAEIDGGPLDRTTGNLIDFRSPLFQAYTAYTTGSNDVGVQVFNSPHYYSSGLGAGTTVFSGTEQQVRARLDTAALCAEEINSSNFRADPRSMDSATRI
jgi:hypothetical protein